MITVCAAIIEKDGLILAARRKSGSHLAGYWEFPGGKLEPGETMHQCLIRELEEEFGISCAVGDLFSESLFDYKTKTIRLLCFRVQHQAGSFQCREHDQLRWLPVPELPTLHWAPADVATVTKLHEEYQVRATLNYYRDNAGEYTRETVGFDLHDLSRQRFLDLLEPDSAILDLGCGSGRDSLFFMDHGHRVTPVDAVREVADCAEGYLQQQVRVQRAEELRDLDRYDGVWACASLLHIPKSSMHRVFINITGSMKKQGVWYMSFKAGTGEGTDREDRFYNYYSLAEMQGLLARFPRLRLLDIEESSSLLRGQRQKWLNVLVRKC